MQIVTSPPPDRRLLATAVRHKSKGALRLFRVLGVVLLLAVLLDLFASVVEVEEGVVGIILGLLATFAVPAFLVRRAVGRCWQIFRDQGTYTISDWGIERTSALTRAGYAWAAVSGIDQLSGQLLFSMGRVGFLPMSTAALGASELEQTLAKAAENGIRVQVRK